MEVMKPRERIALVVLLLVAGLGCRGDAPREEIVAPADRLVGWAIASARGPLPAERRRLRAPYESLSSRIDWLDVPAAGVAERLRDAGRSGMAPDLVAAERRGDLEDLGDAATLRLRRLITPAPRNLELGTPLVLLHDGGPRASRLRDEVLQPPPAGALLVTGRAPEPSLATRAREAAVALRGGDDDALSALLDAEALATRRGPVAGFRVLHVAAPAAHGNDAFAFVPVIVVTESERSLGTTLVITAFRRDDQGTWRLLLAADDPITVRAFLRDVPAPLSRLTSSTAWPASRPALVAPEDGRMPEAQATDRFGRFTFTPAPDAVLHVVEFAHASNARVFVLDSAEQPEVSAGSLWTVEDTWRWRVWAITAAGRVSFSEVRRFMH